MKKQIKKKFWTTKRKISVAIFCILSLIVVVFFWYKDNDKVRAEKVLVRAKELIASLPDSEDPYRFKKFFPSAAIIPASYKNQQWILEVEKNKNYGIVFILPKTREDYMNSGGLERIMMQTGSDPNSKLPVYVVINPIYLQAENMKGVNFDYFASVMLHETVHVYQRSLLMRQGKRISLSLEAMVQREKEAYYFQTKFINKILFDNNIENRIIIPNISTERQRQMTAEDLSNFCKEVDRINEWKLGFLCTLVVCEAYPDLFVSFANMDVVGKNQ